MYVSRVAVNRISINLIFISEIEMNTSLFIERN